MRCVRGVCAGDVKAVVCECGLGVTVHRMVLCVLACVWCVCVCCVFGMPDYNPTHPAMDSIAVTLVPPTYANTVSLTTGLTLNWNIVGDRLDFQAVYSGVAWCVAGVEWGLCCGVCGDMF